MPPGNARLLSGFMLESVDAWYQCSIKKHRVVSVEFMEHLSHSFNLLHLSEFLRHYGYFFVLFCFTYTSHNTSALDSTYLLSLKIQ